MTLPISLVSLFLLLFDNSSLPTRRTEARRGTSPGHGARPLRLPLDRRRHDHDATGCRTPSPTVSFGPRVVPPDVSHP